MIKLPQSFSIWVVPKLVSLVFIISFVGYTASNAQTLLPKITSIYWSDGDSGRINGSLKFRLANIDAPETGGVGARGGAKCEAERVIGYEAKTFIVHLTRNAQLEISKEYGTDRYGRIVIDLLANNADVGDTGMQSKHLLAWPHEGRKALSSKPNWCD